MVAIVLLVVVPLVPGVLAVGWPAALIGLPVESIIVLLLLRLVPWRPVRVVVATGFAAVVTLAVALASIDAGYEAVLDIPFDPIDWQQLGDAFGVVQGAVGMTAANGLLVLLAVTAAAVVVALAWAALRTDAAARESRACGTTVLAAAAVAWIAIGALGAPSATGPAAAASIRAIAASASHAAAGIAAVRALPEQIAGDIHAALPGSVLLTSLRGKDVVFAFVESYGQVAVQGTPFSSGVRQVLRDGEAQLTADGYSSQSAFLTSPTFGGISWLAHSTFQTGLWIDRQPVYSEVIRSDRFTLTAAFGLAGWRTVSDVPSDTVPWPYGTSFYHFDTLLNANDVGYRGPAFGYARIPDQYTWKHFAERELAGPHQPVMAEIDLVSSHTPWAPLPQLVPWSEVGDGSVFDPQPARGESASVVWQDPAAVQRAYGQSIEYSLGSLFAFLHDSDDPDLVIVVLGDHQPATIVSGQGANHDVPISIIAKDPAVFSAIAGWHWQDGMLPAPDAPVWPMSAFRDRFLDAFSGG